MVGPQRVVTHGDVVSNLGVSNTHYVYILTRTEGDRAEVSFVSYGCIACATPWICTTPLQQRGTQCERDRTKGVNARWTQFSFQTIPRRLSPNHSYWSIWRIGQGNSYALRVSLYGNAGHRSSSATLPPGVVGYCTNDRWNIHYTQLRQPISYLHTAEGPATAAARHLGRMNRCDCVSYKS